MTFYTDENISPRAARMLDIFDAHNEVRALEDKFDRGTPDVEWMGAMANWDEKPVVVCGDGRILKNKAERTALRTAGLTFVFLANGWTKLPWEVQAYKYVMVWPKIV